MNHKRLEVKTNYPGNLSYLIQYLREELSKNNDPVFKNTYDISDTQWDNDQKSQYIESIMISGMNQYFIIFDQDPEDYFEKELRYIIINGNKRANVINEFYNGGLTLSGLKNFKLFNGLTVSDIPQEFLDHSFNSVQITTIVAHE